MLKIPGKQDEGQSPENTGPQKCTMRIPLTYVQVISEKIALFFQSGYQHLSNTCQHHQLTTNTYLRLNYQRKEVCCDLQVST